MAAAFPTEDTMSGKFMRTVALIPLLAVAGNAAAELSEEETNKCEDAAYKFYNECLMGADSIWQRYLCDLAFQVDRLVCSTQSR
jgi:hypothetical protein